MKRIPAIEHVKSAAFRLVKPKMWFSMAGTPALDFEFTERVMSAINAETLVPVVLTGVSTPPALFNGTCNVATIPGELEIWVARPPETGAFGFEVISNGSCIPERGKEIFHHRKQEIADYLAQRIAAGNFMSWNRWWEVRCGKI